MIRRPFPYRGGGVSGGRIISLQGKLPGRMHATYEVNLPRPREQTEMKFLQLRQQITDASELVL